MKKNINKENLVILLLNIGAILVLLLIILPHLMMSSYNYASGDDWSYGTKVYHAIQSGGGLIEYFSSVWSTVTEYYHNWEPRWASVMFAALSPANINENYYHINTWFFLTAIITSQLFFIPNVLLLSNEAKKYLRPIIILMLILEILYVPYPTDTFYWWTGSVNYTFAFSLTLIYFGLLIGLVTKPIHKQKHIIKTIFAILSGTLIAANNFFVNVPMLVVSLSSLAYVIFKEMHRKEKKNLFRIITVLLPVLCFIISFIVVLRSPALQNQLDTRAGGKASTSILNAIILSMKISIQQIFIRWMNLKVICFLLLALPFGIFATHQTRCKYKYPILFSLFSFGLFASMISVEIYINNEIRSTYGLDIWYYSFFLFLFINEIYWIGWIVQRKNLHFIFTKVGSNKLLILGVLWTTIIGCFLTIIIYLKDLKTLTSYQAYNYINNNWSQQYAEEWEERLSVLHDSTINNPVFSPISLYGGYITMYDFYEEDNIAYWINEAAAKYYDKESIHIK